MYLPLKKVKSVLIFIFILCLGLSTQVKAQTDSTKNNKVDTAQGSGNLLGDLNQSQDTTVSLLPQKMIFSQRWFWGEHGLMRHFKAFKLSKEERDREMHIRRRMLVAHQALGITTLLGMAVQGFLGVKLYRYLNNGKGNGNNFSSELQLHKYVGMGVDIGYFSTACMVLFAPPRLLNPRKGFSSIKLHKGLAIVHFSAMIATNVLTEGIKKNPKLMPWHRAAALTLFGAYGAAVISITLR